MSVRTIEEIKADIWSLDTVEIRKVLRYLNNTVRKTINPTVLASAKHEVCHQKLIGFYTPEQLEKALLWHETEKNKQTNDEPEPPEFNPENSEPEPEQRESKDPILQALMAPVMAAVGKHIEKVAANTMTEFGRLRTEIHEKVGEIIGDWGEKLTARMTTVEDALMASQSTNLTVLFPETDQKKELGVVHKDQGLLIQYLSTGCHVFLTGPAGSGKSTAAEKAALALGLKFGSISCSSQDTVTRFLGYNDAEGHYHTTEFRIAYAEGGLFLIDEIDAGNPNVLAVLNSALSNAQCAFPDGMVKRHDKFLCVATGNTWGTGRTIQYVGRNAIDAATLNRFVVHYWDYDEALETSIAGMPAWSRHVQACRAEIKRRGVNFLITPRASIHGAKLLKAKVPLEKVLSDVLFPNLDPDIIKQMPKAPQLTEV